MEKKDKRKIVLVFLMVFLVALGIDVSSQDKRSDGVIVRGDLGEDDKNIHLLLNMEGVEETYEYMLEVESVRVTKAQAEDYFSKTIQEIDVDFDEIVGTVPWKEVYQDGMVEAEWSFEPWDVILADGTISQEKIPTEGALVHAMVTLHCGEYEKIYQFSFEIKPKSLSTEEKVLASFERWIEQEMQKEGEEEIHLPQELEGVRLSWSTKTESIALKVLILECIAAVVLLILLKKEKEDEKRKLEQSMEFDYPEIIEQFMLLLGAGMTIRQVWNRIATRYSDKRQKREIEEKPAFERILRLNRRLLEGENERIAYQQFADETGLMCYHRFVRLLLGNLEKGASGTAEFLEQESRQAYEQRVNQAKKLGEEASTRMLLPLMIMMLMVMAITMIPAVISFAG